MNFVIDFINFEFSNFFNRLVSMVVLQAFEDVFLVKRPVLESSL